jgi:D-alanine-D-alanine ligase
VSMETAVILINKISEIPTEDELDVLDQASQVEVALDSLGYACQRVYMDLDLKWVSKTLISIAPKFVFNLVESIEGKANLIHLAPALLESLHIPYSGCHLESIFISSNKPLAKKILLFNEIPTPAFIDSSSFDHLNDSVTYIAKPLWEDASVGIDDNSLFKGKNIAKWAELKRLWRNDFFVEEFIEGREFNLSILGGEQGGARVLPPAEILFRNFPVNKPRILGYGAKWDKDSFEYINTPRTFEFSTSDQPLLDELKGIALKCWQVMDLKGYARVDFRVSKKNKPYVLEINANPCISADAGFYAAAMQAGLSFKQVISLILTDALTSEVTS